VRPADARTWFEGAADHLSRPGAQSREQQEAGFVTHDPPLEAWLDGFLQHWLEQDVIRPKTAKACAVEREVLVATGL
jgi:GMP synthase (glutamine-hydrolysing)